VKYIILKFNDVKLDVRDIAKVRGYFAKNFSDNTLLHNHLPKGKYSYKFPKIQYRLFDGNPALVAMEEGIDVLKEVFFLSDEMTIGNRVFQLNEKEIISFDVELRQQKDPVYYKFVSPYMALNQENYKRYQRADFYDKAEILAEIIKNNLKTISKGFSYEIPDFDSIKIQANLKPKLVNFKNVKMLCFTGDFKATFLIPDYWGLGKQTARGFGVVKQI
jgi:CRISPR/Cas system endoribonuclease Cas6 (RAMP superfamily)